MWVIISAASAQAKICGLLRDRQEIGKPGDFEQAESVREVLEILTQEAGPEAALALSKALGLDQEPESH